MENYGADERMMRLERALLARGRRSVGVDALGEADLDALRAELLQLGFEFRGCDIEGFAYTAEFRRQARGEGERATHARGSAFSEHNAIVEAALAALASDPPRRSDHDHPSPPTSGAPIERLRHARPWRRARRGPPVIG